MAQQNKPVDVDVPQMTTLASESWATEAIVPPVAPTVYPAAAPPTEEWSAESENWSEQVESSDWSAQPAQW